MLNYINSKALEHNLAFTNTKKVIIPELDLSFLESTKTVYGINKRLNIFLNEFYHPYPNTQVIIDLFRQILLEDYWFYHSEEYFDTAQNLFLNYFEKLAEVKDESEADRLLQTILIYVSYIYNYRQDNDLIEKYFFTIIYLLREKPKLFSLNYLLLYEQCKDFLPQIQEKLQLVQEFKNAYIKTINFWIETTNLFAWYQENISLFENDYGEFFVNISKDYFSDILTAVENITSFDEFTAVPTFKEMTVYFRQQTNQLKTNFEQIYYLIYLLNNPLMKDLYRHLIYDINKKINNISTESNPELIALFIENIFALLKDFKQYYADTVLDCLNCLGKELAQIEDKKIRELFTENLINFGFEYADNIQVSGDWQLQYNKNHVKNIRVYLDIFSSFPDDYKPLISALIIYLKTGGIFISDTDLFQKDVSKLLNSDIINHFKLIKQLCRIFPVYFNEIGAEGDLRVFSTLLDELTGCKDIVIHFLRKQIHTESNNTHIHLCEKILDYWDCLDLEVLKDYYPDHVILQAKITDYDKQSHEFLSVLKKQYKCSTNELFNLNDHDFIIAEDIDFEHIAKKRVIYLLKIHKLLKAKYSFDTVDLVQNLKRYNFFTIKEISALSQSCQKTDNLNTLNQVFILMEKLKNIILRKEFSEGREDIYFKRHIAAGIPSMYGRYSEQKFDSLGLTFRFEKYASSLLNDIISSLPLQYITASTLKRIYKILELISKGLKVDGIESESFNANLMMFKYSLTSNTFSILQFKNIFQFMQDSVKEIINEFFFRSFDSELSLIIPVLKRQNKINDSDCIITTHKISESFYRDLLSSAFLIQSLDNFISSVLESFNTMLSTFPENLINQVMHYDPEKLVSSFDEKNLRLDSQVFLGGKAYFLKKLKNKGMPIPDGFVFSTELFRYREAILRHPAMSADIDKILLNHIKILERKTKLIYGDILKPLLLSVRSGAPLSMPGAMNTFLNIGLNDKNVELIGKNKEFKWTIWDCYRRLIQSWGMSFGIERDVFDNLIIDFKKKFGVSLKVNFTAEQMREIAYAYKEVLNNHDIYLEQDLYKQARAAMKNVLNSWNSERAIIYRKQLEIADEWGTAVVIQKMAFGNISLNSGTGVVFTHDPSVNKPGIHLFGDYTLCSQGEDVVGGLVHTLPVSEHQAGNSVEKKMSLESSFPEIYKQLCHYAKLLINNYGFNHQEIEFTFESPKPSDLFILQTRNQVIQKSYSKLLFENNQDFNAIATGTGIGLNVINGKVAFDMDDLEKLKIRYPQCPRILIRPDTVPDDIALIFESESLITARGGVTSHAAVTGVRLGKTGIVNCKSLKVYDEAKYCEFGNVKIHFADDLAIDPNKGLIYLGHYKTIITKN